MADESSSAVRISERGFDTNSRMPKTLIFVSCGQSTEAEKAVQRCGGAVVLLHLRGEPRSSLWVNQKIAMLAYRQFPQEG